MRVVLKILVGISKLMEAGFNSRAPQIVYNGVIGLKNLSQFNFRVTGSKLNLGNVS